MEDFIRYFVVMLIYQFICALETKDYEWLGHGRLASAVPGQASYDVREFGTKAY
jgi:hypothetical protein